MFIFDGSVLSGSATVATHDLDVFTIYATSNDSKGDQCRFLESAKKYHPRHLEIHEYLIEKAQTDPVRRPNLSKSAEAWDTRTHGNSFCTLIAPLNQIIQLKLF